jgi:uncharacterized protein YndB with AHSA1/START domain
MPTKTRNTTLVVSRRIEAPPQKIYAAWTDPAKMKHWFGPGGSEVREVEADVRVGGHYRVLMRMPDGAEHEASGVYREVVSNQKLVFTWTWTSTPERETLVTVLIRADGAGSTITLTHERLFDELDRDNHESGWTEVLERLDAYTSH